VVAPAAEAGRLDQAAFPEMPQVASTPVQWPAVVIAEVARGDHPERADGGERAALRSAELVRAVAQGHLVTLAVSRQTQVAHENVARIDTPFALVARPSTAPVAIEAFAVVAVSSIVEWIVSVEHKDAPDVRITHGHLKRGGHVCDRRVPQALTCRPPAKSG